MPSLELISLRFEKRKISIFQVFFSKSLKEFLCQKIYSLFVLKYWKIKEKESLWEIDLWIFISKSI